MIKCNLCNVSFNTKSNLNRHINKETMCIDKKLLHELIEEKDKLIESLRKGDMSHNSGIIGDNNMYINVKIEINPITKLQVNHIETDKMKNLIEKYDDPKIPKNSDKLNILLSGYIKEQLLCDDNHPENHAVKYIKKKPPTYNAIIEDSDGNTVNVIKGLKDTCELLSDPILDQLKVKLSEFIKKYKPDTDPEFDYCLYEDAIKQLKKELNKTNVKKALSSVLQNDILNNIQMKLHISSKDILD
jgi:hypothetical protein